jgi:hypothetical protein
MQAVFVFPTCRLAHKARPRPLNMQAGFGTHGRHSDQHHMIMLTAGNGSIPTVQSCRPSTGSCAVYQEPVRAVSASARHSASMTSGDLLVRSSAISLGAANCCVSALAKTNARTVATSPSSEQT